VNRQTGHDPESPADSGHVPCWVYFSSAGAPRGSIVPKDSVCISPNDRGFMFADGVYEFIRSYGGRLFRPDEHLARLKHSLDAVRIDSSGIAALKPIALDLLKRNGLAESEASVYVQITRGTCRRALVVPEALMPTVYVEANPLEGRPDRDGQGVSVVTVRDVRWSRCDIKAIGLLPNVLARMQATEAGAAEAVFVRDGVVTEGTHTNVFGVLQGTVHTHPADNHILAGITRSTVLELCCELKIPVSETGVPEARLPLLDELFLAATTTEVLPVLRVNSRPVADGKPGPVTQRLQSTFRGFVDVLLSKTESGQRQG